VIPKIETLVLENFIITEREFECMEQLKYGIERNKNFRDLYIKYKTSNKHALFLN
jgi:DNA-binding CsgD family transcriptional regulator